MEPRTLLALALIVVLLGIILFGIGLVARRARKEREMYHRRWLRGNEVELKPDPIDQP